MSAISVSDIAGASPRLRSNGGSTSMLPRYRAGKSLNFFTLPSRPTGYYRSGFVSRVA